MGKSERQPSTYDVLLSHGIERRSFLRFCTLTATALGLGPAGVTQVVAAMETKPRIPVIWLHGLECTCCSESFIRSSHPIAQDVVLNMISLDYDDTLQAAAGFQVEEIRKRIMKTKPSSTQTAAMVPTAAQLQGNFYDRCLVNTGINGVPCVAGYTDNNGNDRSTFLVNPAAGKTTLAGGNLTQLIGTSIYNPASPTIGQAMLKYLPSPNLCTAAAGIYNGNAISPTNCPAGFSNHVISNPAWNYGDNYIWQANEIHPRRNDTVRFDWNLNEKNRVFVRYSQDYDKDVGGGTAGWGIPVNDGTGNYSPTLGVFTKPGHGYALGLTTTLSPTMVNEFTFGKIFNGIGFYEANDTQVQRSNMGNPPSFDNFSTDPLFNDTGKRWLDGSGPTSFAVYVPTVAYGDTAGRTETAPSTNPCWNGCPYTNKADSWTFADNLSKVVGKHNLKAGIYVERTFKLQDGSQGTRSEEHTSE